MFVRTFPASVIFFFFFFQQAEDGDFDNQTTNVKSRPQRVIRDNVPVPSAWNSAS